MDFWSETNWLAILTRRFRENLAATRVARHRQNETLWNRHP